MEVNQSIANAFEAFNDMTILVVGDVMIDAYYWGKVDRISPEAPVPVVDISRTESRLGGAANVALNLKSLGAEPIICSVIGKDEKGALMHDLLIKRGFLSEGIVESKNRRTTVKTRVISDGQHLLRVDEEDKHPLSLEEEKILLAQIKKICEQKKPQAIVFEDYDKGCLTPNLIKEIVSLAKQMGILTTVDPKKNQFLDYKQVSLFKPNLKELSEGLKVDVDPTSNESLLSAMQALEDVLGHEATLLTLSEHGVAVKKAAYFHKEKAHPRKILDVSGAGDTVIATATLCLAAGMELAHVASISNIAGGLVCEEVGVVSINKNTLLAEAQKILLNAL